MREAGATNDLIHLAAFIYYSDRENAYIDLDPVDNLHLRVGYMLDELNEDMFKTYLQRQEKFRDKMRDLSHIFEMLVHSGGDLLRQFIIEPRRQPEITEMIKKLFVYGNDVFEDIRKRYTCVTPKNFPI